jgi:hypothetical protein
MNSIRILFPNGRTFWRLPACAGVVLFLLAACTGCLNPKIVNSVTDNFYPLVPGQEPYLLVRVINDTTATIDIPIVYDNGVGSNEYIILGLTPEMRETGIVLPWPVLRLAIGDLDDPFASGLIATLPNGNISAVPFGHDALVAGTDYDKGDGIIFYVTTDSRSQFYITVSIGLIDATHQPTQFTRADPFEAVRLILLLNGF